MPPVNNSRIRSLRKRCGWKLYTLAERAEVKYQHMANIESGHADPGDETLQNIADALTEGLAEKKLPGVTVAELLASTMHADEAEASTTAEAETAATSDADSAAASGRRAS